MNTKTVGVGLCLLTACVLVSGQAVPKPSSDLFKLLDGYTLKKEQGLDTRVGQISKPDGITLHYDIGRLAGNYAEATRRELRRGDSKKSELPLVQRTNDLRAPDAGRAY